MNSPYSAVILAAGEGKRMFPLTSVRPKCMIPVAGIPLVEHLIKNLFSAGIREVVFVVGYREEKVRSYFKDGRRWAMRFRYVTQPSPAGTADALKLTAGLTGSQFLMVNADVLASPPDLAGLARRAGNVLGIKEVANVTGLGVVEVDGKRVVALHEKLANPPTRLASTGIYLFDSTIYAALSDTTRSSRGEYELPNAIQLLIDRDVPVGYQVMESWRDVSYPWEVLALNSALVGEIVPDVAATIEPGVHIQGACHIGRSTRVRSGSYIEGPVFIGEGCDVGPNCFIRACSAIGDNCRIGAAVEIKNCIIMSGTQVAHLSYAGDSIIGENCNLGAGAKIANLRLDGAEVCVSNTATGLRKLGAMIGDGVQIGVNACINPGTVIPDGSRIGPGMVITGVFGTGT